MNIRALVTILSMLSPWPIVIWVSTVNFWASLIIGTIIAVIELHILDAVLRDVEIFEEGD
mgnify:CR=1 FL=1